MAAVSGCALVEISDGSPLKPSSGSGTRLCRLASNRLLFIHDPVTVTLMLCTP